MMNRSTTIAIIIVFCTFIHRNVQAQNTNEGLTSFPKLIIKQLPGAPVLAPPIIICSSNGPIVSEGHGLAAPAFYDMNEDGVNDLLIGEFGSGIENGRYAGNFIRVYINEGTSEVPKFSGLFDYARPPFQYQVQAHGTPYSVDQYCCMGFTPQFIDLDQDGFVDMFSGQYQGEVSWFRGSQLGFYPGEPLPQDGNPRDPETKTFVKNQYYWIYSSASFGDFTGDGLPDLVTGGRSLRISENIGTASAPSFAKRKPLLDVNGNPLKLYNYTTQEKAEFERMQEEVPAGGDHDLSPFVFDWDNDGVLDLLVTNSYSHKGLPVISFFRGVKTANGFRFETPVNLFEAEDASKAFPGSAPRIFVTDWNSDGIFDLLIGASVVNLHNTFNHRLSWLWEKELGILPAGKDPANLNENTLSRQRLDRYKQFVTVPQGLTLDEFMTLRHKGYVYVMLGTNISTTTGKVKIKNK